MRKPPETLGIRHVALRVKDIAQARRFYVDVMGYRVEREPDPENLYLTNGNDNLALHAVTPLPANTPEGEREIGALYHFGIILKTAGDVDAWAAYLKGKDIKLEKEPKTHSIGTRFFFVKDPEGNVLEFMHHPPITDALAPWYLKPGWIAVLTVFALGPFALPLVWRTPKLGRTGKAVGTILVGLYSYWLYLTVREMAAEVQRVMDQQAQGLGLTPEQIQKLLRP